MRTRKRFGKTWFVDWFVMLSWEAWNCKKEVFALYACCELLTTDRLPLASRKRKKDQLGKYHYEKENKGANLENINLEKDKHEKRITWKSQFWKGKLWKEQFWEANKSENVNSETDKVRKSNSRTEQTEQTTNSFELASGEQIASSYSKSAYGSTTDFLIYCIGISNHRSANRK